MIKWNKTNNFNKDIFSLINRLLYTICLHTWMINMVNQRNIINIGYFTDSKIFIDDYLSYYNTVLDIIEKGD